MPRDTNQRAFLTVQMALGERDRAKDSRQDPERVERGKKGGSKGGKLRAERLSPERRSEIAKKAAAARWTRRNDS